MLKYVSKLRHWILPIAWMGVIFMFSHQPATQSSKISSSVTEKVLQVIEHIAPNASDEVEWWHGFIRKNAHFFIYLVLGCLLVKPLKCQGVKKPLLVAFIISVLYAVSDETHQLFIEGRSGQIRDVLIDSMGALTGLILYKFGGKYAGFFDERRR
jgi:VanZ family protein